MNKLDAEKLGQLARAVGTKAWQRTYRDRGWKYPPAKCEELRAVAVAAAFEVVTAHNGRRGRLSTREAVVAAASAAAVNALRVQTDGRKAASLSLGSGRRTDGTPELPAVESTESGDGTSHTTASDCSEGFQRGGEWAGVVRARDNFPVQVPSARTAAWELAIEQMAPDARDTFENGPPPDRHRTGINAQRWRDFESAKSIHAALLAEVLKDTRAIEAWQDRWFRAQARSREYVEHKQPKTSSMVAAAHLAMGRTYRPTWEGLIFRGPLRWQPRERRSLLDAGESVLAAERTGWAGPLVVTASLLDGAQDAENNS